MSTYGNPIQQSGTIPGDATAANQALQLAQETITANETTGIKTDTDLLVTATGAPTDAAQTDPTQTANEIELLKGLLTFILTLGSETDGVPSNPIANTSATIQNVVRLIANNLYVLTNDLVLPYTPITPNGTFGALGQAKDPAVLSAIITSPGTGGYTVNAAIKYICQNLLANNNTPISSLLTSIGAITDAAVTNPASSASQIALLKGIITVLQASLPLPTGASTSANQLTANADLDILAGFTNSSDTYTAAAVGATVDVHLKPKSNFTIYGVATGAVTSWTVALEGSLDGTNFFSIGTITNAGVCVSFTGRPFLYYRTHCTAIVLGPGTNVIVNAISKF